MGYSLFAKRENSIECVVGGTCLNCRSKNTARSRRTDGLSIVHALRCGDCSYVTIAQLHPEDHLERIHVF